MATTTTIEKDCGWCRTCLYDGWGDCDASMSEALGDMVVVLFEMTCAQLGRSDIYWQPGTSEVIAECATEERPDGTTRHLACTDRGDPSLSLEDLRVACSEAIGSAATDSKEGQLPNVGVDALGDLSRFLIDEDA